MGWAEQLPSGRYRAVYRDANGRRHSAGTFAHKAEAVRKAGSAEDKARKSLWSNPDAAKRAWGEWCDEWWPTRTVEPGTLSRDASRRRTHLDERWSNVPLAAINRQDVRGWWASMRRAGVSSSTAQRAVHLLSASLSAAVDAEILPSNPAARLKFPQGAQAVERFLTPEEYDAIQAQMPTTNDQLVMHVLCFTGMRWGELAGLHWNRVDLERRALRVVETWDERTGQMKAYPKGKRARDIDLPEWLADLLAEQERRPTCGQPHAEGKCRSGLVLTTAHGSVLRLSNWAEVWRDATERAGVEHVRVHDMRHSAASWLVQGGISLAEVGRILGHKSTATTQKYAHLAERDSSAVMAVLGRPSQIAPLLPHEEPSDGVA